MILSYDELISTCTLSCQLHFTSSHDPETDKSSSPNGAMIRRIKLEKLSHENSGTKDPDDEIILANSRISESRDFVKTLSLLYYSESSSYFLHLILKPLVNTPFFSFFIDQIIRIIFITSCSKMFLFFFSKYIYSLIDSLKNKRIISFSIFQFYRFFSFYLAREVNFGKLSNYMYVFLLNWHNYLKDLL